MNKINSVSNKWLFGLSVGLVAGLLDAALIYASDPLASIGLLFQSAIAWTLMGWVIFATESGFRPVVHGMFVTTLLNIPWFIQFSILNGHLDHLIPLICMSLVFGLCFGFAKRYFIE